MSATCRTPGYTATELMEQIPLCCFVYAYMLHRLKSLCYFFSVTNRERWFPGQDVWHHAASFLQTGHRSAGAGSVSAAVSQGKASHRSYLHFIHLGMCYIGKYHTPTCVTVSSPVGRRWWSSDVPARHHVSGLHLYLRPGGEHVFLPAHPSLIRL